MTATVHEKTTIFQKLKKPGKQAFWLWIGYQTLKGTLTTTFIWIPLAYAWLN
jgi:hypothetical protein